MLRSTLLFLLISLTALRAEGRQAYTAAVVEFAPSNLTESPEGVMETNLARYEQFVQQAASQGADLLVFPEYGLTTTTPAAVRALCLRLGQHVPDPALELVNPCEQNVTEPHHEVLRRLSCMARDNNLYLVVNLLEREPCEQCPDNFLVYNTNVAFDRQGTVVARYRKFNLFSELALNVTQEADLITFSTDFGATVGLMTCMDILFLSPAVRLVRERGVTDVVFPSAWFSELPFLTAVQAQAAWSIGLDVPLLASGYNRPSVGSTGSGIHGGRAVGTIVHLMAQNDESRLLVARLPETQDSTKVAESRRRSSRSIIDPYDLYLKGDYMINFTSVALSGELGGVLNASLCQAGLCCNVEYELSAVPLEFQYRLLVLDGIMSHDGGFYLSRTQICAVVACAGEDTQSCSDGLPAYSQTTTFSNVRLTGNFSTNLLQPNTLLSPGLAPLQPDTDFTFVTAPGAGVEMQATLALVRPTSALHSFAIFAHDYE